MLTNKPVFKLGYEHFIDSSSFSFGINAEYGRYSYIEKGLMYNFMDEYELVGGGLMIESRYYPVIANTKDHFGFFTSAFVMARRLKETVQDGVEIVDGKYNIDNPSISTNYGYAFNYGLALGYRTGCPTSRLHAEIVTGYAFSYSTLKNIERFTENVEYSGADNSYIRIELNLVASF